MAKISEIFKLGRSQAELDFVDIDISRDTPLFIDPHFLAHRYDSWSQSALSIVNSFFQYLLELIKADDIETAKAIFIHLEEPNETCLGLSKSKPRGRSINKHDIEAIFKNLIESKAAKSGLVEELQDTIVFVDGVGKDKLSDITTNIIREKLIKYTQEQCQNWEIPLQSNMQSGFFWNPRNLRWENKQTEMLIIEERKLLLVPKGIVSFCENYTPDKYHRHFVLNFLQNEHLRLNTAFVKFRENKKKKTRTPYVAKTDLKENVSPGDKADLRTFTLKHPLIFRKFKNDLKAPSESLGDTQIEDIDIEQVANFLIDILENLPIGIKAADEYEKAIMGILELLLYPDLICPNKQVPLHQGRKRVDIVFDNAALKGSFFEFHRIHKIPCQYIFVECKNQTKDPHNPELDQLSSRFSTNRGKVGLLVFRNVSDMKTLIQRCNDTFKDDRGLILPLSDRDLIEGLENKISGEPRPLEQILRERSRIIQLS